MAKDTFFTHTQTMNLGGKLIDLSTPKVMGIVNITPDSFYGGSRFNTEKEILTQVEAMLSAGADMLDLGAYSTRPGAKDVTPEEETNRLLPALKVIKTNFPEAIISVDTFRATLARIAVNEGAHIINDISGGELDSEMFATIAHLQVPYILMHNRGTTKTMHAANFYDDLVGDILFYFSHKIKQLRELGVKDVVIDPGFCFAKNREQNFKLLKHLSDFKILGLPILAGLSRKSMVWKSLDITPEEALNGTTILNTIALQNGAKILRVHDVAEAKQCIKLLNLLGT
jgi:dihydropteroate synthase